MQMTNPIFQDKAVRNAFTLCVDTNEIVQKELGRFTDASALGNRLLLANQTGLHRQPEDGRPSTSARPTPEKAKSLLDADGWWQAPTASG